MSLADDRVLFVGGLVFELDDVAPGGEPPLINAPATNGVVFDLATGSSAPTGPQVSPRFAPFATLMDDGRVLVGGGGDTEGAPAITSAEFFTP